MKKILAFLLLLAPFASAQVVVNPGGGGSATSSGSTISGCTSSILYADASSLLKCDPAAVVNGSVSTAGRSILTIQDTISGSSATSNFLNITGAFPATLSAETRGITLDFTGDNDNQTQRGIYLAGPTSTNGSVSSSALYITNNGNPGFRNTGVDVQMLGSGTSIVGGSFLGAPTPTNSWGLFARGARDSSTYTAGGQFWSGAGTTQVGIWVGLGSSNTSTTTTGSAAIIADNGAVAANIFEARDNGTATSTTAASANVTVLDGAQLRLGPQVLTGSTMTPTTVGEVRTVTHSYAWTNAMLVALGASLTGDVNVAVLPAKTQVNAAFVVIDTPGTDANTLTVSCGDTGAGATNYVKAGDAKAAANTVYGDNITGSETGTSLFSTFFITNYVPSYTATTTVSCRFTKTVGNLSTQTGSTGRVILTTTLLP